MLVAPSGDTQANNMSVAESLLNFRACRLAVPSEQVAFRILAEHKLDPRSQPRICLSSREPAKSMLALRASHDAIVPDLMSPD